MPDENDWNGQLGGLPPAWVSHSSPKDQPGQSASPVNQSSTATTETPQQGAIPAGKSRRSWDFDQGNPAYGVSQLERRRYQG